MSNQPMSLRGDFNAIRRRVCMLAVLVTVVVIVMIVIKDDVLIGSGFFPKYMDISYEISHHESLKDYLDRLFKDQE